MAAKLAKLVVDRRAFVAMIALVPLASAAEAGSANDPVAAVTAIYRHEIKGEEALLTDKAERNRELSKALAALWAKVDALTPKGEEAIDFDVVADTNGLTLNGFSLKLEKRTATTATVAATLRYEEPNPHPRPSIVRYDLVFESGAWTIDEIRGSDWSVRAMLTSALKAD
jgi:hypothetical protein